MDKLAVRESIDCSEVTNPALALVREEKEKKRRKMDESKEQV